MRPAKSNSQIVRKLGSFPNSIRLLANAYSRRSTNLSRPPIFAIMPGMSW